MNFDNALKIILKHEGGFVNHPRDPGGITNLGVTLGTWSDWVGRRVGEQEMRNLTVADVAPVYKKKYWDKVHAGDMPYSLGLQVFDFGVNAGVNRAIRYVQSLVGSTQDGLWGPKTQKNLDNYLKKYGEEAAVRNYAALRLHYYRSLKTFKVFGRGWTRRTNEVRDEGLKWIK